MKNELKKKRKNANLSSPIITRWNLFATLLISIQDFYQVFLSHIETRISKFLRYLYRFWIWETGNLIGFSNYFNICYEISRYNALPFYRFILISLIELNPSSFSIASGYYCSILFYQLLRHSRWKILDEWKSRFICNCILKWYILLNRRYIIESLWLSDIEIKSTEWYNDSCAIISTLTDARRYLKCIERLMVLYNACILYIIQ